MEHEHEHECLLRGSSQKKQKKILSISLKAMKMMLDVGVGKDAIAREHLDQLENKKLREKASAKVWKKAKKMEK